MAYDDVLAAEWEIDMLKEYDICRQIVENELEKAFAGHAPQKGLFDAMRYSLLAGGKRIRPIIVLKFAEACGEKIENVLPAACAVEMLHTYSLIHDDLPCMDNDDLRRGMPTNHKVYGECTAVLAGDALQAAAFEEILLSDLPYKVKAETAKELALAAGENGICGGQYLDMDGEKRSLSIEEITNVHELKTASMIKAAARMGVIAGGGSEKQLEAATKYADAIGVAFQIRDDILDYTSTTEELGKPVGSDKENEKSTFASLLGIEKCEKIIEEKTDEAKKAVSESFEKPEFLVWLADMLAKRKY